MQRPSENFPTVPFFESKLAPIACGDCFTRDTDGFIETTTPEINANSGNPSGTSGSGTEYANTITYTGRQWDEEIELYHFRARYYDPASGIFIARDPLEYVDGLSLYRGYFVPVNSDPFGNERYITGIWHFEHKGIAIRNWKCNRTKGKWEKGEVTTFDFSVREDFGTFTYFPAIFWYYGNIVDSPGLTLKDPRQIESSPCQDLLALRMIRAEQKSPPFYSAISYRHCHAWAETAIQYGMSTEPTGKECDKLCRKAEVDFSLKDKDDKKCIDECTTKIGSNGTLSDFLKCMTDCKHKTKNSQKCP